MLITSTANPLVKEFLDLHDKKGRQAAGSFLLEGRRELELAVKHGVRITRVLYTGGHFAGLSARFSPQTELIEVSPHILEKVSYRGGTEGFVAAARIPERRLADWRPPEEPFIVVLDQLEKPGNIGAVLRTAAAAGTAAVLVCGGSGDLYNPNLIRASLGALFILPVFALDSLEAVEWLRRHKIKIVTASPYARQPHWQYAWPGAQAVVLGSEKDGVSGLWSEQAAASVLIPMSGGVDSLNVSVSAAVLIYEAARQRGAAL
ncbi:MAG: RNA methyltransferase [Candidatus Margulisbacteria bacterium]|jgi:TrmH family RNA methyltransferase|nr:RNA methyltransferase [Candidatus Margulisiibacteriota bacterium]